jgi:WbqC-like protein family
MRLSSIQPQYFPRLHYVARMLASDVFVLQDEVQFVRTHRYPDGSKGMSYQAHTPLKGLAGLHLLTVSTTSGGFQPIQQMRLCHDQPWARKHVKAIKSFYASSPNRRLLWPEIEMLLGCRFSTVAELDIATTCWALGHVLGERLRIPDDLCVARVNELLAARRTVRLRQIALGSECLAAGVGQPANASERILSLCRMFGADEYMSGDTAVRAYLDTELLRRHGVEVTIQSWTCPSYPQQHNDRAGFIADLSIIDLLMNVRPERVASFLATPERTDGAHRAAGPAEGR